MDRNRVNLLHHFWIWFPWRPPQKTIKKKRQTLPRFNNCEQAPSIALVDKDGLHVKENQLLYLISMSWFQIYLWLYGPLLDLGRFVRFLILYIVGRTPWTGDQPVARPLPTHRTTQTQNKRKETSMPRLGFEPRIPAFEQAHCGRPWFQIGTYTVSLSSQISVLDCFIHFVRTQGSWLMELSSKII
jgi:hypothetical protein